MARVKRAATLAKERKRAKQEIKDFIPAGGTFKPIADEGIEIASTSGAARKKRARVTKMNWNGGPSKGVRTSFRNKGAGVHDDLAGGQKQGERPGEDGIEPTALGDSGSEESLAAVLSSNIDNDGVQTTLTGTPATESTQRLYIGNLPFSATEQDVRDLFGDFAIHAVELPLNPKNNRPCGYGFVNVPDKSHGKRAIEQISGSTLLERKITVQFARSKTNNFSQHDTESMSTDDEGSRETEADYESGEISDDSAMNISSEPEAITFNLDGSVEHIPNSQFDAPQDQPKEIPPHPPEGSPPSATIFNTGDSVVSQDTMDSSNLPTLGDLNAESLKLQLRYFHITRDPAAIDLNSTVARCIVCGVRGHLSSNCSSSKKQEQGKPLTKNELNSREAKPSLQDDESLWRTSGVLSDRPANIRKIRLGCYECGKAGHLGNDCPTRRPGKEYGTSSWSLYGRNQTTQPPKVTGKNPPRPKAEIKIRGLGRPKEPIYVEDESDDLEGPGEFFQSRVPPLRHGRISIAPPKTFGPRPGERNSPRDRDGPKSKNYAEDDGSRDFYTRSPHDHGHFDRIPDYDNGTRSSGRPGQASRTNHFQPPLPSEPLPTNGGRRGLRGDGRREGETYRPMPSSARDAWRKHLL